MEFNLLSSFYIVFSWNADALNFRIISTEKIRKTICIFRYNANYISARIFMYVHKILFNGLCNTTVSGYWWFSRSWAWTVSVPMSMQMTCGSLDLKGWPANTTKMISGSILAVFVSTITHGITWDALWGEGGTWTPLVIQTQLRRWLLILGTALAVWRSPVVSGDDHGGVVTG